MNPSISSLRKSNFKPSGARISNLAGAPWYAAHKVFGFPSLLCWQSCFPPVWPRKVENLGVLHCGSASFSCEVWKDPLFTSFLQRWQHFGGTGAKAVSRSWRRCWHFPETDWNPVFHPCSTQLGKWLKMDSHPRNGATSLLQGAVPAKGWYEIVGMLHYSVAVKFSVGEWAEGNSR